MLVPNSEEAKVIRHFQSPPDNLVDINPVRDKCPFFPSPPPQTRYARASQECTSSHQGNSSRTEEITGDKRAVHGLRDVAESAEKAFYSVTARSAFEPVTI